MYKFLNFRIILDKKIREANTWTEKYLIAASELLGILKANIKVIIANKLISIPIQTVIQEKDEIIKIVLKSRIWQNIIL